jgi:hypothetical protein
LHWNRLTRIVAVAYRNEKYHECSMLWGHCKKCKRCVGKSENYNIG